MFKSLLLYKEEFKGCNEIINIYLLYLSTIINVFLLLYLGHSELDNLLTFRSILISIVLIILSIRVISNNCTLKSIHEKRAMGRYYEKVIRGNPKELIRLRNLGNKYIITDLILTVIILFILNVPLGIILIVVLSAVATITNLLLATIYLILLIVIAPVKLIILLFD